MGEKILKYVDPKLAVTITIGVVAGKAICGVGKGVMRGLGKMINNME